MIRKARLADVLIAVHAAFIAVSVVAFFLIVNRPVPGWVDPATWARAYAAGMAWTGPLYIVSGFAAAVVGLGLVTDAATALRVAALVALGGLAFELLGTSTGVPFGPYGYGDQLGWKVFGLVPLVIPLSWFMMLYGAIGLAARQTRDARVLVVLASLGLVAWDVLMDPAMSAAFPFWSWHRGGAYYGMPLVNWLGWFLTGIVLATIAVRSGGGAVNRLSRQRGPAVIYALNGLFPLALAAKAGLTVVALLGGVAMSLYLAATLRPAFFRSGARARPSLGRI